ncbi:hypothetical protein AB0E83_23380 [Streptomyces sp. NPDC035033]|uniref:hypothetical protein n=1 Tax=Streptomyces sp. NPDC035033 TaxID=3155368 RepID=UPI0033FAA4D7
MTTQPAQQEHQRTGDDPVEDTAGAVQHAEATAEETIGTWPACGCPHHRNAA